MNTLTEVNRMKARIIPLYFDPGRDAGFDEQLVNLERLLGEDVEWLEPRPLGAKLPPSDAVVFPQFLGEGYRKVEEFKAIDRPILVITSEFGTMSMWDWELIEYLREQGVSTIGPYDLEQTRRVIAALKVRQELRSTRFLAFQDNPGEGHQASIFKRFYWWEDECTKRIFDKFGVEIVYKSFRELGAEAKAVSDAEALEAAQRSPVPMDGNGSRMLSAYKMCVAITRHLDADPQVRGVGINCLNESHFSDTTPCLAWNLLYEQRKMIWGCEADTVSMLSKFVLHRSLGGAIMMTNLYPFLMGQAALKHERIEAFPQVTGKPENHVLVAHCGYLGVVPQSFATEWKLKPKVLRIVDNNATAIDARLPEGPVTLAKLHPSMERITVAEGELKGYAQYPGSDCLNGGVIELRDGPKLMRSLASHHYLLMTGHRGADIRTIAPVFSLNVEEI
jgi:hypothetical protein